MFIQTENTPNPNMLKFLPGRDVTGQGSVDFADSEVAQRSPLAVRLFAVEGVVRVFFGTDFVTVGKADGADWAVLKPQLLAAIMDHYTSGAVLLTDDGKAQVAGEDDSEVVAQIKELIETRVRPAVANDGGDIVFRNFEDGVVYLHMQGSCSGCPSSTATLKHASRICSAITCLKCRPSKRWIKELGSRRLFVGRRNSIAPPSGFRLESSS